MLGAVIGVMALIGGLIGIPVIFPAVLAGAFALIELGIALALFAVGLSIYANLAAPKLNKKNVGILMDVITSMAVIGTVVGIVSPLVLLGSAALIVAGVALITMTAGMAIFAASNFDKKDAKNMNTAITSLIAGVLGYEDVNDVGIGALAWVPMMAGLLVISSAALIVASLALLPISMALAIFKKTVTSALNCRK